MFHELTIVIHFWNLWMNLILVIFIPDSQQRQQHNK